MEGKAWVDGGRLAENDPNQSACLWEWNKTMPYLYLRLHHGACFPFSRRVDERGKNIVTSEVWYIVKIAFLIEMPYTY